MTEQYKKEEQFLRVLANAYITHKADELLELLPDDFGYDSMWVFESITTKEQYKKYIVEKLAYMKMRLVCSEFAMMKDKFDNKPLLMITNTTTPEGGRAVFVVKSDKDGNVKRLDLTAAEFFRLEPMSKNNILKRTYQTLLDNEQNCEVRFITKENMVLYKGTVSKIRSLDAAWGLACMDSVPDDFCMVYDAEGTEEVGMFTPDTRFPVDFVFVNDKGKIIKIHPNAEPRSKEFIRCAMAKYVVELNAGQCCKNNVEVGDYMEVIKVDRN